MAPRFLKTESFRLTGIFAALFGGAMLILLALVYVIMHQAFRSELLLAANHDLATVRKAYMAEGIPETKEVVGQLLGKTSDSEFLVLESAKGKLAGNLPRMAPRTGQNILTLPSFSAEHERRQIIGRGEFIAPDLFVFAGRDLSIADDTEEGVLNTFVWVLVATLVLALGGGILVSNSFLARMDAITRTCRAIMAGHLTDRIPESGTRDELDRLAATINAMLDRIGGLMENVRQITSDIAHDLRTPLTRLRHHLELARNVSNTVKDYEQAIDRAISDSETILSIFSALLRIGQIEAKTDTAQMEEIDLSNLLVSLNEIYGPVAEDANHTIQAEIEPAVSVFGDRQLLTQMFSNLIDNAVMHTPSGTSITIRLKKQGHSAVVEIADDGPGIPPDEREKVLRRFYRMERARSTPGSGLGLTLAASIAAYHDAQVEFSDNGPGLIASVVFRAIETTD